MRKRILKHVIPQHMFFIAIPIMTGMNNKTDLCRKCILQKRGPVDHSPFPVYQNHIPLGKVQAAHHISHQLFSGIEQPIRKFINYLVPICHLFICNCAIFIIESS